MNQVPLWQRLLALLAVVIIIVIQYQSQGQNEEIVKFHSCVDGDTMKVTLEGRIERVRFLAVDTPELSSNDYYAQEAADYTCNMIRDANNLSLEYDPKADTRDRHGRLLAWIYVDDVLLQKELVKHGYARVYYIYDDYKYVNELYKIENSAKNKGLGIWSDTIR